MNDTTILAMLSQYSDIPEDEANEHLGQIEHEENIPICEAVLGRISPNDLGANARQVYDEIHGWSVGRTRRTRNENLSARSRNRENRTTIRMTQLHEQGIISNDTMLLYGISGDMPEYGMYMAMSAEEKETLWAERMERRLGPNWRSRFDDLPPLLRQKIRKSTHNWIKEGF